MTGLVRKATFLSACGVLIAANAMAFVPSPVTSVVPCGIQLVGRDAANNTDLSGNFTVTIKDIAGNPIPNAAVVFDFTSCCNDIRPSVVQHGGGAIDVANHKKVNVTCNAAGTVTLAIQGVANKLAATPGHGGCMKITANGVLITDGTNKPQVDVAVYDLDGGFGGASLGVAGPDLSAFLSDFFNVNYHQRADYDESVACSEVIAGSDLSKFLTAFFNPKEATNDAQDNAACP